jgi:hypothetical protein
VIVGDMSGVPVNVGCRSKWECRSSRCAGQRRVRVIVGVRVGSAHGVSTGTAKQPSLGSHISTVQISWSLQT